jgi:hypothetical protein
MTYTAKVQFKFDATWTPSYGGGFGSTVIDDFIPEEHFLITAPAADLNATQYFKLFEKFMLCVGMDPSSIRSGAMNLVFNEWVKEEDMRQICREYELTMNEDLSKVVEDRLKTELDIMNEWDKINQNKILTKEPTEDPNYDVENDYWEKLYWELRRVASTKIQELENELSNYKLTESPND